MDHDTRLIEATRRTVKWWIGIAALLLVPALVSFGVLYSTVQRASASEAVNKAQDLQLNEQSQHLVKHDVQIDTFARALSDFKEALQQNTNALNQVNVELARRGK